MAGISSRRHETPKPLAEQQPVAPLSSLLAQPDEREALLVVVAAI
jgi:hypothetical protein